jgi:hypothetical protein
MTNYDLAGKQFESAAKLDVANKGELLENAIDTYKKGSHWKEAVDLINREVHMIPRQKSRRVAMIAANYFNRRGDKKMRFEALRCFSSLEEKADMLRSEGWVLLFYILT